MDFINAYGWLCLIAIFLIAEACTTNFVTIWFALGALAALLTSFVTSNDATQVTVFFVVSVIAVIATLPLVKKLRRKKKTPLNADRNIGRVATVIDAITAEEQGRVRLDGVEWSAVCAVPLAVGDSCRVLEINSTVLHVAPIPELEVL